MLAAGREHIALVKRNAEAGVALVCNAWSGAVWTLGRNDVANRIADAAASPVVATGLVGAVPEAGCPASWTDTVNGGALIVPSAFLSVVSGTPVFRVATSRRNGPALIVGGWRILVAVNTKAGIGVGTAALGCR